LGEKALGKTVVVSFEGTTVKIVHALRKGKGVTIERVEEVPGEEFGSYLQREKATEFIVTREFFDASFDILRTPVLKGKYLDKYVESQIGKATNSTDVTFIYTVTGEQIVNNRKVLEVYYYMVKNSKLRDIVEIFHKHGKTVRALYPSVFAAASLLDPDASEESKMGIIGSGTRRVVFSTQKGAIQFIRSFESLEAGFTNYDIQNMDTTISYCIQNYGINPSSAMLIGKIAELSTADILPAVPLSSLRKSGNIHCTREVYNKYFIPIASLFAPRKANILNSEFKILYSVKNFMAHASRASVSLVALSLCFLLFKANGVMNKQNQIENASEAQSVAESIYAGYEERADVLNKIKTAVKFLNSPSSDLHRLLLDLTKISMEQVRIDSVDAKRLDGSSFLLSLRGEIPVHTYSAFQQSFNRLSGEVEDIKDIRVKKKTINLESKTFTIEVKYK
jgi:hypothetical protein